MFPLKRLFLHSSLTNRRNSPPISYLDGSPVAGEYPSGHMDILGEMDKVVGSLVQELEDRNLLNDTIIVFTR